MLDFKQAGDLGVFVDEEQLTQLEAKMACRGYLKGMEMATTFNMLRANDLIWSFVINNYLMGRDPFPFDLLFGTPTVRECPQQCTVFIYEICIWKIN